MFSVLLDRSAGIDTGYELTSECYRIAKEISKEWRDQDVANPVPLCPLALRHRNRFEPSLIAAVKEMGEWASEHGSYVKPFRLHPTLAPFAGIQERDGFEELVIDEAKAIRAALGGRLGTAEETLALWDAKLRELDEALAEQRIWYEEDGEWQFTKKKAEEAEEQRAERLQSREPWGC